MYVGIDLAKNVFAVHGVDEAGKPALVKPSVRRAELMELVAKLPPCVIGMEACSGAHHWARQFAQFGHTVRLMAPKLVAPYRMSGKRGKNDATDAAAICEAVQRPNMRFVPVKTEVAQARLCVHRMRRGFVEQRTAMINRLRGLLSEFGVVLPQKAATVRRQAAEHLEDLPQWANTAVGDALSDIPAGERRRRGDAPTLTDVGRAAGVSKMCASLVLNGARTSARISEETRARVLAAAEQLRYRPNATARGLSQRRMNTLGVVTHFPGDEPNLYFLEVFTGIVAGARAAGQSTTVLTLDSWEEARERIPAFCDGRIDGLIVLGPMLEDDAPAWLPTHTPLVSLHANRQIAGVANLTCDDEAAAFEMVSRMLRLGHRRILHIGGPEGSSGADQRLAGYRRAHTAARVRPAAGHVLRGPFTVDAGRTAMQQWLGRPAGRTLPDAVFCANDAIAMGCMEALSASGVGVPDDVSVAGFDDTLAARAMRLSTVHQPLRELGRRAVEVLLEGIDARQRGVTAPVPAQVVLPTEIREGATVAPPRCSQGGAGHSP